MTTILACKKIEIFVKLSFYRECNVQLLLFDEKVKETVSSQLLCVCVCVFSTAADKGSFPDEEYGKELR